MSVDPSLVRMYVPNQVKIFIPPGLAGFKRRLFDRVADTVGGPILEQAELEALPDNLIPAVGCTAAIRPLIDAWAARGRKWIYWDRGYARRVFATWLPRGKDGGYYRWHIGTFQMQTIRHVPDDRWRALNTEVSAWRKNGRKIVVAAPSPSYLRFHNIDGWVERTVAELRRHTDRPIEVREKTDTLPLSCQLHTAHALVTHGSNAAVEAVIMGCPVFVDRSSAAALVGLTDLSRIEHPVYPEREPWLHSLAYSNFCESELFDGTVWRLIA